MSMDIRGKYKPYPVYKDSGVEWLGEVPEHWRLDRFKWTVEGCINGIWGDDPDGENDIVCIRVADFDRSRNLIADREYTLRAVAKNQLNGRLLKKGDLLIEKSGGGDQQPVGTVILFDKKIPAVCSNFIARMPVRAGFNSKYLSYLHSTIYTIRLNTCSIKQNTGIQNLDSSAYLDERVSFPSYDEQSTIAAFLDHETAKIDTLITEQERLIELLQEKRTALISHAVTKGLNPDAAMKDSGVEWLGEVPEHWKVMTLKRLCVIKRGKFSHRPRNDEKLYGGEYPFIQTGDVANAYGKITFYSQTLNDLGASVSEKFPAGTLAMSIAANIGDVAILGFDAYFPDSIVGLIPNKLTSTNYLFWLCKGLSCELEKSATSNTQENLNVVRVGSNLVACPSIDEQQRIISFLDIETTKIDALIAKARQAIDLLKERRTALISAAVTGKIDVRNTIN